MLFISEKSYHLVIAALAILKAGGAFLFIDYEFPKDRIQYMISEVNAKIVLEYLPSKNENKIFDDNFVYEYNLNDHNYDENIFDIPNVNCSDDICCVFFTSGTTGNPKGILLNHDNVINCTFYSFTRKGKENLFEWPANILAFTKVTFIIYLVEIFLSLINQMTIILCNEKEYNNPILLADLITKYKIESAGLTNTRIKY